MAKGKERNETEYLRGLIRQLKSENRNLKKQLQQSARQTRKVEALIDIVADPEDFTTYAEPEAIADITPKCPKCRHDLKTIDLGLKLVHTCSNADCKYRYTEKTKE